MMKGGDIAGLLIRQARLRLNWSQEGLCRGICAPSYLSKIEQGKAAPSPEVTELLLRRLGLVWTPEPESLEPCWKALLSGSPDFASCYERLVQPRQESLACSPLAADALLLAAFYEDELRPLPEEWEPFLSTRQLALQRALQGRWEEAVRLEPLPLLVTLRGKALYVKGDYTVAIEVLRDACRSAADAGYPHLMLSCRLWMGNCYSDLGRMEEMLAHFAVAERLAEALGDTDGLSSLRYNVAATQLELGQPEKALSFRELILSPQSEIHLVREWLFANGCRISDESFFEDEGKYYTVMKVLCPGGLHREQDMTSAKPAKEADSMQERPDWQALAERVEGLSEEDLKRAMVSGKELCRILRDPGFHRLTEERYGPCILHRFLEEGKEPCFQEYLTQTLRSRLKVAEGVSQAAAGANGEEGSSNARQRLSELWGEIGILQTLFAVRQLNHRKG